VFRLLGFIFSGVLRVFLVIGTGFICLVSADGASATLKTHYPELEAKLERAAILSRLESLKQQLRQSLGDNAAPRYAKAIVAELLKH